MDIEVSDAPAEKKHAWLEPMEGEEPKEDVVVSDDADDGPAVTLTAAMQDFGAAWSKNDSAGMEAAFRAGVEAILAERGE